MDDIKATVNLEGLHRLCSFHRRQVLAASRIGCFYCLQYSTPSEIKMWIDERQVQPSLRGKNKLTTAEIKAAPEIIEGQTAMCPKCTIDAVLPDKTYGFDLTDELLNAMHKYYFTY